MTNLKKEIKKEKGITLIALAVTIIVLIILAGISITTLTGEKGLINQARNNSENAQRESIIEKIEADLLQEKTKTGKTQSKNDLKSIIQENGYNKGELREDSFITKDGEYTINYDEIIGWGNSDISYTEDGVPIPKGFVYVGGRKESGIVISDNSADKDKYKGKDIVGTDLQGNQYVWIPVDGILGENGTIEDVKGTNVEKKILLGRYDFDELGVPLEINNNNDLNNYLAEETQVEHTESGYGNTVAKDIEGFISSVRTNGGYYIARFEVSKGINNKVESKYDKTVWNNITQPNSAIECQDLYEEIKSDLINSYAWDTAILFIQKYGQKNYSMQSSLNNLLQNTGKSEDKQLNIYDMASNCIEWTTETVYLNSGFPCTYRGGNYVSSGYFTSERGGGIRATDYIPELSFRSILYF